MSYTYSSMKAAAKAVQNPTSAEKAPSLDALRLGAAPTQEQLGHRVDLPDAMRSKMETAFGADLSAVKLYESQTVADAGAEAVTQGSTIAFAPGMLDFSSYGGQALLGHELSHVVSQARGEVTGSGFLSDHALEARADREGAMAAAGQQIAAPTAALSPVSAAPAAGPMQASKAEKKMAKHQARQAEAHDKLISMSPDNKQYKKYQNQCNSAMKWQRYWSGNQNLDASSNPLLSPMSQLERAKQRYTDKHGALNHSAYFGHARDILASTSREDLLSDKQKAFRERLVDDYSAYRKQDMESGGGGNAFQRDLIGSHSVLADMYGRMMGKENIVQSLSGDDTDNQIANISDLADTTGVTELLLRQHRGVYGQDSSNERKQQTMRSFWDYTLSANSSLMGHADTLNNAAAVSSLLSSASPEELQATRETTLGQAQRAKAKAEQTDLVSDYDAIPSFAGVFQNKLLGAERSERLNEQERMKDDLITANTLEHMRYGIDPSTGKLGTYRAVMENGVEKKRNFKEHLGGTAENHQRLMENWDRRTGNKMTTGDAKYVEGVKLTPARIQKAGEMGNRFQSSYADVKDTWKNELELEEGNYNGKNVLHHLVAAVNAGGDEHTTGDQRMLQYVKMVEDLDNTDEAKQTELMQDIKKNYYEYLKRTESTLGTDFHNLSGEELSRGNRYADISAALGQDYTAPLMFATQFGGLFDQDNPEDQEFIQLARYFRGAKHAIDATAMDNRTKTGSKTMSGDTSVHYKDLIADSKAKLAQLRKNK